MSVPVCKVQHAFQTWNGEMFETRKISSDSEEILVEYVRHKRAMPNCPARIVRMEVVMQTNGDRLDGHFDPSAEIRV